jgi:hypothetical protein
MTLGRLCLVIGALAAVLVAALLPWIDASYGYGSAAPEEYFREFGPSGRYGDVACAASEGVEAARSGKKGTITAFTGAGADMAVIGPGTSIRIFDIESGWTGDNHDILVVVGVNPDLLPMHRYGPHFIICGERVPLELVVLRQYCRGQTGTDGWNNGFEEIAFSSAREIWLADDLYATWKMNGDILAVSRLDEEKEAAKLLKKDPATWRVRSFSDAMPDTWFAPWACRRDLD